MWVTRHKYCSKQCANTARRGIPLSEDRKEQNRVWSTGRKHTPEAIAKMSGANCHLWKGGKSRVKPKCFDCEKSVVNFYAKRCWSCYSKVSKGSGSSHWQGGITPINYKIRNSEEYKKWRTAVFSRDGYTCINCGKVGGYLEADHIKPFSLYPELRLDVSNGRTVCKSCHNEIGWRGKATSQRVIPLKFRIIKVC